MIVLSRPPLTTAQLVQKIAFSILLQAIFSFFLISSVAHRNVLGMIFCALPTVSSTIRLHYVLKEWKWPR